VQKVGSNRLHRCAVRSNTHDELPQLSGREGLDVRPAQHQSCAVCESAHCTERTRHEKLPLPKCGHNQYHFDGEARMPITNREYGTNVNEIADGIYRISTPVSPNVIPGGFTFNQYLVVDEAPLLFHTGLRKMFPLVREAVASVVPLESLRFIGLSHVEADECGSINEWLAAAPDAVAICGRVAASVSMEDLADRMPRELADGERLSLGKHVVRWFDTPHLPHAWECGLLMEEHTETLLCGDLLSQPGEHPAPLTESDVLGPSEAFRARMDYFSHTSQAQMMLERLAGCAPRTLACMHGSAWRGNGAQLLRELGQILSK
jgi:glyoxylase-like metal-dependent hydrolase (beta-lactamase superfamily II)